MTASFHALTLIDNTEFSISLNDMIENYKHFEFKPYQKGRLNQIDTEYYNVLFYELNAESDPLQIVYLCELAKKINVILVAESSNLASFAFEIGAVDFLLLNSTPARIAKCFDKIMHVYSYKNETKLTYKEDIKVDKSSSHIVVKDVGKVRLIDVKDIIWVNGAGNYVELHFSKCDTPVLHRETMKNIEKKLEPEGFIRIHRSTLVRKQAISELMPTDSGDYKIKLKNDIYLNLSRRYKSWLESIMSPS